MKTKLKKLSEQVIVVTGASSGIGLTTARLAASRGAKVVIASRDENALKRLEKELNSSGSQAKAVTADVSQEEDVHAIAEAAKKAFGRFDTWINNAGTSIYGRILDVPTEDERKLFDTNFWGVVYGSKVAAQYLRKHGGAIINLGSVASDDAIPLQAAYSASKHAVKAYTDTLRMELEKDGAPVSVTLIKPTAINTPFFEHAKTYMDAQPIEPSPLYTPEDVAEAILRAAEHPERDILVGDIAPLQSAIGRLMPGLASKFGKAALFKGQKSDRQPQPGDNVGLDRPSRNLRERGNYPEHTTMHAGLHGLSGINAGVTAAMAAGAGMAVAWWIGKRRAGAPSGQRRSE